MIISYLKDYRIILLNLIPIIIIMMFIFIITKRLWISYGITSLLIFIMGIINKTKLYYRDDVFKFEDILLAREAAIMTSRYEIIIRWYTYILIGMTIIIMILLKKYYKKINLKLRCQIIIPIILIISSIFLYHKIYVDESLYQNIGDSSNINVWIATRQSQIRGLIYPFIYSSTELITTKPKDYNKLEIENILKEYSDDNILENEKVNIIAIMLEAYNDFSKFESINFTKDVYEKFHNITNESLSGSLIVNIFGGGTIDTERKFITGFNDFSTFRKPTYSYATYFKEQGYKTEATHPIYGAFYNRNTVNLNLGFENFWNYENKYSKIKKEFITDEEFFDCIFANLKETNQNGKKYFNFSVTYQNHGPYSIEKIENTYIENKGYSNNAYNMFNRYLDGIKNTNEALMKLVNNLKDYNEPTILIVFGDHNPYLGEANYVYNELGINMDLNTLYGFLNYYSIPYFIYGNDLAKLTLKKEFLGNGNTISPNFLMNELFEYIGYKGNAYLKYTSDIKKHIDVINNIYYKEDSRFIPKDKTNMQNVIEEFKKVNYYYANDFNP